MTQYRDHRRLLHESMKTVVEVNSRAELIAHLQKSWPFDDPKYEFDLSTIVVEPYAVRPDGSMYPDDRIGWKEVWIVDLPGLGPLGWTDGPLL